MQMKPGPVIYHLTTFHWHENYGENQGAGGGEGRESVEGVYKKPSKNATNLTKSQL